MSTLARPGIELVTPASLDDALATHRIRRLGTAVCRRHRSDGAARRRPTAAGTITSICGVCHELRGIANRPDARHHRRADDLHRRSATSAVLARRYPMLVARRQRPAAIATQNRGTIGGNIANASPAADTPPALLVYDAELELRSAAAPAACHTRRSTPAYKQDGPRAGRDHLAGSSAAAHRTGVTTTARLARAARRRSRRSVSPDRSSWTATSSGDVRVALGSVRSGCRPRVAGGRRRSAAHASTLKRSPRPKKP